jgi:hypothetical protein
VAYAGPPPNEEATGNDDATYTPALEETVACLTTERETAYAATNATTAKVTAMSPCNTLAANTLNDFQNQLLTEMRNEMKKVLVAATTAAATGREPEEETLQKMEKKNAGAKPEVTSHYVPTAQGTESISRRIVSRYQRMETRSLITSLTGDTSMEKEGMT